jgi:excisionase family DNA binding protein
MPETNSTFNGQAIADALNGEAPLLLRPKDTWKTLGLSERTLRTLTRRGQIPCVRIGRSVRYDPADLRAWIDAQKIPVIAC